MSNILKIFHKNGKLGQHVQPFISENVQYLTIMGSNSYGVSDGLSDIDVYGFTIPPKHMIFPHLSGHILGFGKSPPKFDQYQNHNVVDNNKKRVYDFSIYGIVKYFQLMMENNPNIIDSLFTPRRCVIFSTNIGEIVRENRKLFLHKGAFHKFKGYSFSQMQKIRNKKNALNEKRAEVIEKVGYDTKYAMHLIRLLLEVEQILIEHDIDMERNNEMLKSIRRGDWTIEEIEKFFHDKERNLENMYHSSTLQHSPDEEKIKNLLLNCLEEFYGSIENAIQTQNKFELFSRDVAELVNKYNIV